MRTRHHLDGAGLLAVPRRRHAVVVGGSLAGMLAARVLADHFDVVTLLERDRFPETPAARKGLPQDRHAHGLLERGRGVLERFLTFQGPEGFAAPDDLEALEACQAGFRAGAGVPWSDISRGMRREHSGQPCCNADERHMRAFWRRWHTMMLN